MAGSSGFGSFFDRGHWTMGDAIHRVRRSKLFVAADFAPLPTVYSRALGALFGAEGRFLQKDCRRKKVC